MLLCLVLLLAFSSTAIADECKVDGGRQPGEEWTSPTGFVKRCESLGRGGWQVRIVGCKTDRGTFIPVGSSRQEDGHTHRCASNGDGSVFKDVQSLFHCENKHNLGDRWVINRFFEFECQAVGSVMINCFADDGSRVPVGSDAVVKDIKYTCLVRPDGSFFMDRQLVHPSRLRISAPSPPAPLPSPRPSPRPSPPAGGPPSMSPPHNIRRQMEEDRREVELALNLLEEEEERHQPSQRLVPPSGATN